MKLLVIGLMLLSLTACFNNGASQTSKVNWDRMSGGTQVAKVAGIKSLIRPGIY